MLQPWFSSTWPVSGGWPPPGSWPPDAPVRPEDADPLIVRQVIVQAADGRLTRGPRSAVREQEVRHASPFPVRFHVEHLEPHRPEDLRPGPDQDADDGGQAEEPPAE